MKRIHVSPPRQDERELLLDAFDSNWVAPAGHHIDLFERELVSRTGVGLRVLEDRVSRRLDNNAFYREALAGLPGVAFMPRGVLWSVNVLADGDHGGPVHVLTVGNVRTSAPSREGL